MADLIDDLKVQIEASTQNADGKLDKFIAKMMKLQSTITGLEMSNVSNIASGINQISASIQSFNTRTKTSDFTKVASGMNKLSGVDAQGISNASRAMSTLAANLTGLDHISFDADGITKMADSLVKLGGKQVTEATQNLEFLKTSLADFIGGMNGIEGLTFNQKGLADLVKSVNGLGSKYATQSADNLPKLAANLKSFITEMSSIDGVTFSMPGLEDLVGNITRLGNVKSTQAVKNLKPIKEQLLRFISGLNGIKTVDFDTDKLTNLVASISKLGGKAATNAIPNIQQLGVALKDMMKTLSGAPAVNQNLINMTNALANLAGKGLLVSSASTAMYKGLGMYSSGAKSATKHSFNLASAIGKVYATYWALLRAFGTIRKSIGIAADLTEVQNVIDVSFGAMSSMVEDFTSTSVQKFGMSELAAKKMSGVFMAMGKSLGAPQKEMAEMSIELTKLAADMASFYNVEQEAVGEDLQSVFTGTVRPLRDYGLDLTQASLQQYAFSQGIQKSVRDMTQLEKVQLRYNYVMANTDHIQGDYARTSLSWSNQVRLLGQQFQQLGGIVGGTMINAFKPFLQAMNQVIAKIISVAKAISDALGKIFGWQYQVSGGGAGMAGITGDLDDAAGAADDLAGGAGGAADKLGDAAKNAKKLAGNLQSFDHLNVISSKDDSSGSGGGAGAAAGNFGEWVPAETIWEKYKSSIDSLYELGKYIGDTLTSAMNNIDWDGVYAKAEGFGRGLADFLNGLISPELFDATGSTIAGSLNTALHFLDSFGTTFDWKDFGNSIAAGINGFFNKFDFDLLASTFNTWAIGLLDTMATAIGKTDWKNIGEKVGDAIKKLDWKGILNGVGEVFWASFNAAIDLTSELFGIPKSTASIIIGSIGGMVLALQGFGKLNAAITGLKNIKTPLGNIFKLTGGVKYVAIAGGIAGLVLALDKFGGIKVNWKSLGNSFEEFASALGKFTKGIGQGLINFIDGISDVISPILATTVYAIGGAFDTFASVMNSIPESVISSVTETLLNLFMGFKTYQLVVKAGGLITMFADNIRLFASVLPGIFNSGPILKNLAAALGPSALGGIAFTAIAGGLLNIANQIMRVTNESANNSAIGEFARALGDLNDEVSQKTDEIKSNLERTKSSMETTGMAESQMARDLAKEYETLSGKASLTADDKARLKSISDELVSVIPGLNDYIDKENGYLDIQKKTLDDLIERQELYAQKQAAQEYLVQAYKDQYEAQLNVKNAQDGYNQAMDEYLNKAGLAPGVIDDIKNATLDLNQAQIDFENSPNTFEEKYGVKNIAALKKAYYGLSEEMSEYHTVLTDAQKAEKDSGEQLDFIRQKANDNTKAISELDAELQAGKLSTTEYKQSLSDLNTEFANMDLAFSDSLMQSLALEDFDASVLQDFFTSLSEGVPASAESLQSAFEEIGLTLPDELAKSLAKKEPDVQAEASRILMGIQSGVQVNEEQLITLFGSLGTKLPDSLTANLAEKEPSVQTETLNLLSKLEEGHNLVKENLITVFSSLGMDIPDSLVDSLHTQNSKVQEQAIELLSQILTAEESQRQPLIDAYNSLGAGIIDDGIILALSDGTERTSTAVGNYINTGVISEIESLKEDGKAAFEGYAAYSEEGFRNKIEELQNSSTPEVMKNFATNGIMNPFTTIMGINSPSTVFEGYGKYTVDGFNQGIENNYSSTKGVIGTWVSNIGSWFKNLMGIASPSKIFEGFGGFTVAGFNEGISENMKSSLNLMEQWAVGISSAFNTANPIVPEMGVHCSINRDILDRIDTRLDVSLDFSQSDFKTELTAELQGALSGIIDYDRLGEAVYRAQSRAMQENPTVIGDDDVFNASRRGQERYFTRNKRTGWRGIDR